MDGHRFDNLTRALAATRSRRRFVLELMAAVAGLAVQRDARAVCPPEQVQRGRGKAGVCVCETTGRPPAASNGECPCPSGQERCAGVCVEPAGYASDPRNCGRCGNVCVTATPFCAAGVCVACLRDADCDDGIACTTDRCVGGACQRTPVDAVCEDGNPCTLNPCDAAAGCETTPVRSGIPCSDRILCNGLEVCDGESRCLPGTPVDCGPCLACSEATQNCEADLSQNGLACGSGGHVCAGGACVCPTGQRDCGGTCREYCMNTECPADQPDCHDGACTCRGSGLACGSSTECCPGNACFSGFCCTRSGLPCVTPEQCCSRGCDFDSDLGHRVCG